MLKVKLVYLMEERKEILKITYISIKAKSKIEIYRILTTEGDVYLPPSSECSIDFIKDIITGKKSVCLKL